MGPLEDVPADARGALLARVCGGRRASRAVHHVLVQRWGSTASVGGVSAMEEEESVNWEDERWVKLYTRDSITWKLWGWQARFVMMSLIRKVDRAGVVDVGGHGVPGLAALLEIPVDIVRDGIAQLTAPDEDGESTVVWQGPQLVLLHFIEAQKARTSNTQRQRDLRDRRRNLASNAEDVRVTNSNAEDVRVTNNAGDVTTRVEEKRVEESRGEEKRGRTRFRATAPRRLSAMTSTWRPRTGEVPAGVDFTRELQRFRDHYISESKRKADWEAAWRNWLRRAEEFGRAPRASTNGKRDQRYGRADLAAQRYDESEIPDFMRKEPDPWANETE